MADKDFGPSGFISLYSNDYKKESKHPDFRGNVLIPFELINMASESEDCTVEIKGEKYLKFAVSAWHNEDDSTKPLVSGRTTMFKASEKKDSAPARTGKRKLS